MSRVVYRLAPVVLGHVAAFGGAGEVQRVGDREKIADLMHFHAGLPRRTGQGSARVLGQPAAKTTVQRLAWSIARRYQVQAYSAFQSAGLFRHSSARCCTSPQQQRRGECAMTDRVTIHPLRPGLCAAALVTVTAFLAAPAQAGQCPADKMSPGARTSGEMKPKDVTDTVLGHVWPTSAAPSTDGAASSSPSPCWHCRRRSSRSRRTSPPLRRCGSGKGCAWPRLSR